MPEDHSCGYAELKQYFGCGQDEAELKLSGLYEGHSTMVVEDRSQAIDIVSVLIVGYELELKDLIGG